MKKEKPLFVVDPIVLQQKVKERIPKKPGIYIGWNLTKNKNLCLAYIGRTESQDLQTRLHKHNKLLDAFSFEIIGQLCLDHSPTGHHYTRAGKRAEREKELIEKYHPPKNLRRKPQHYNWYLVFNKNGREFIRLTDIEQYNELNGQRHKYGELKQIKDIKELN